MAVIVTPTSDGGRLETTVDDAGHILQQAGFNAAGRPTYRNVYDVTGALVEQDGYDTAGLICLKILHTSDGAKTVTHYAGGVAQDTEAYRSDSTLASVTNFFSDGTRFVALYDATGAHLTQTSGYDAAGQTLYINVYDTTGALTLQTGFANGVKTITIQHGADGGENVTRYALNGSITGQEVYDPAGKALSSTQVAADGTYTVSLFDHGVLTSNNGFSATGLPTYSNSYTNGVLTEQDGYDNGGHLILKLVHQLDGGEVDTHYASNGLVLDAEVYGAGGVPISSVVYAADRSSTVTQFANGKPVTQSGVAADGHTIYTNHFTNGMLTQQQGYSANGALASQIDFAADGSSVSNVFAPDGHVTQTVDFTAAHVAFKTIFYYDDGSRVVVTADQTTGLLTDLTAFAQSGVKQYENKYSGGQLVEQDGFDSAGNLSISVVRDANGTVSSNFDSTGALTHREVYDVTGRLTLVDEYADGGRFMSETHVLDPNAPGPGTPLSVGAITFDDEFNMLNASPSGLQTWTTTLVFGARTAQNEAEYYSDATTGTNPFAITNGVLSITAQRAADGQLPNGTSFTSGVLETASSFSQQYGYFEVKAKMPTGGGVWPAFWLLPANQTALPELDVVETLGRDPNDVYMTSHTAQNGYRLTVSDSLAHIDTTQFHTYGVNWTPSTLTWYIDGVAVATQATPPDMNQPMYLILDLAVGGSTSSFAGAADPSLNSATMLVDYVRAYANAYTTNTTSTITGTPGNDTLIGHEGNDVLIGGRGDDYLDGGAGVNTAVIADYFSNGMLSRTSTGWIVTSADGVDTLVNIQILHFIDAVVKLGAGVADISDTTGKLIEHDTFGATGQRLTAMLYNNSGAVASVDLFATDGHRTQTTIFAADGSKIVVGYDSAGHTISQFGYSTGGVQIYANYYDTNGHVTEQDGFDANGTKTLVHVFAADGTSSVTHYSAAGLVLDNSDYYANGTLAHQTIYAADRSSTTNTYSTSGVPIEQDGYASNGVATYQSLFDGTGFLYQQTGYDAAGHKSIVITHAVDGSSGVTHYNSSGAIVDNEKFASGGALVQQTTFAADGSSTVNYYSGGSITEQDGISATGLPTYKTFYDPTGRVTEQDGYDASGHKTLVITHAADGSSVTYNYDGSGVLTNQTIYNFAGVKIETLALNSGGGYDIVSYVDNATLVSMSGADVFAGGGVNQTYQFSGNFGHDVIQNFHAGITSGHDTLKIDHNIFSDFTTLLAHATETNGHAVIDAGHGNVIELTGIHLNGLVAADFLFF